MKRIAIIAAAATLALATGANNSPLKSAADYRFTEPTNSFLVRGEILGPAPVPPCPVRGEDRIYLAECAAEMATMASLPASDPKAAWRDDYGWELFPRLEMSGLAPAPYRKIWDLLAETNGVTAFVTAAAATAQAETNLWPLSDSYTVPATQYAADAARRSGVVATNHEAMAALATNNETRILRADDVAAFYRCLHAVHGVACDVTSVNSGAETPIRLTEASRTAAWDGNTNVFIYTDLATNTYIQAYRGSGLYEATRQSVSVTKRRWRESPTAVYQDSYSDACRASMLWTVQPSVNEPVTALVCTNAVLAASNLTAACAWVIARATYSDYQYEWLPFNDNDRPMSTNTVSISTNAAIALPAAAKILETNGWVAVSAAADYDQAYSLFFAATGLHAPDDNRYPPAPGLDVFGPNESAVRANSRTTSIEVTPMRIALVMLVDWHSGFHTIRQD